MTGRTIQLSSPARDVRPGHRDPGRSLRPPRERDSIQRSSALTGYGQWATSPNRSDRACRPGGRVGHDRARLCLRGCRYCLRGCPHSWLARFPSARQVPVPHPDRAAPGPPTRRRFPASPISPPKAPPDSRNMVSTRKFIQRVTFIEFHALPPAQIGQMGGMSRFRKPGAGGAEQAGAKSGWSRVLGAGRVALRVRRWLRRARR